MNEDNATQSEVDGKSKDLSKAYKEMNNKFNAYSKAIEKVKRKTRCRPIKINNGLIQLRDFNTTGHVTVLFLMEQNFMKSFNRDFYL